MKFGRAWAIVALVLGIFAAPFAADAQQPGKVFRIGILGTVPPTTPEVSRIWEALLQGLRDLGYVEGQNIVIERRYSEGRNERLPDLAADLVRLKVDVIVAAGTPPPYAAKRATTTIPIVMTNASDPVGSGLVASLARPGGNITGLSLLSPELAGKLELLKETVPKVSRVAVLWNPANPVHTLILRQAEVAARSLRLQLQILEARGPNEFDSAFSAMTKERAGALLVLADPMFFGHRTRLADLAAKSRLPSVFLLREHADAGGLMAYGPSTRDNFRRAATYVDKILKGAKPGDLPIEQPTKFELVINLKTAKALGLTIPRFVLGRADEVLQ